MVYVVTKEMKKTYKTLPEIYEPHIKAWSDLSDSQTTLWFWCTEIGWAIIHPILEKYGWIYRQLIIWDKGVQHVAGNYNSKTARMFPIVTEVCGMYIRKPVFINNNVNFSLQKWLRSEWRRTGLTLQDANIACNVKNVASRKYLTNDHLWYPPSENNFQKMKNYANIYGKKENKPYFTLNGVNITDKEWKRLWSFFNPIHGLTNVWDVPPLRNNERIKKDGKVIHKNQKPLELMDRCILSTTNKNGIIWEPFGGLFSACMSAKNNNRRFFGAEINSETYKYGLERLCGKNI